MVHVKKIAPKNVFCDIWLKVIVKLKNNEKKIVKGSHL